MRKIDADSALVVQCPIYRWAGKRDETREEKQRRLRLYVDPYFHVCTYSTHVTDCSIAGASGVVEIICGLEATGPRLGETKGGWG